MILIVYGTRPEFIKIKPLIREMELRGLMFKTLFTGQHKDLIDYNATYNVSIYDSGKNRLDSIISACMNLKDEWFEGVTHILVQGDTTSVVGMALAAMHRKIKVIHLEAGLRSNDTENPFPEENNRRIVTTIAEYHLCPTTDNKVNLILENIDRHKVFVVGNTGLDNLLHLKESKRSEKYILVTLHRRENHDNIDQWFEVINDLAAKHTDYSFVLPLHPNPNVQKHRDLLENVWVTDPMPHGTMMSYLMESALVITDSGGLQEECSFLNKKCLVCRKATERPEALGITSHLVPTPEDLSRGFSHFLYDWEIEPVESPFGDGYASTRICDIFQELIYV